MIGIITIGEDAPRLVLRLGESIPFAGH